MPTRATSRPIELLASPFVRFARLEAGGGIVLLAGTVLALILANSPWQEGYHHILEGQVSVGVGRFVVSENRHEWINDGLMSLFFFLVGLEIKREILVGELSSFRRAAFPFAAALGGMIVPASLYLAVTRGAGVQHGWAVPISTDIAFALGLLTFLGNRVPLSLKVFVTALAIVDDIFAVLVIAVFYTKEINYISLLLGIVCILLSAGANALGVRKPIVYGVIGIFAWFGVLNSGVHATIAGILLAFTIPATTFLDRTEFLRESRSLLDQLESAPSDSFEQHTIIHTMERNVELAESPLHRIEHQLQPWISFLVIPLFAFANAGVNIGANIVPALHHPVSWGITLGLVVGKPLGICLFGYLAVKAGLASLADNVSWRQVLGGGCLCGIGFTMSLFVTTLAFEEDAIVNIAKIAILAASVVSGIAGAMMLISRPAISSSPRTLGEEALSKG
jgi:Na+:H+ antiporter, NhaA family